MKGVIVSINSTIQLIDITHDIGRHNIKHAALVLKSTYPYFPKGSVHIAVIDPGVGGKRKVLCLKNDGHYFIAPDNGVLSLIIRGGNVEGIRAVTNDKYFLEPVSNTFHGRDIFAPVAAHLSTGIDMSQLGKALALDEVRVLEISAPFFSSNNELTGEIISIDHFGNLVTNIDRETFNRFKNRRNSKDVAMSFGNSTIQGVSESYDTVGVEVPVAIFGSRDLLEISVNQADASTYFKVGVGQTLTLKYVSHVSRE
jgi:S-adenosylmethionine hydrolase